MAKRIDYTLSEEQLKVLDAVKQLFDLHRTELGFVLRPSLLKSIQERELIISLRDGHVVGAVHYHHRRDKQTTLYHIAVHTNERLHKIGTQLIEALYAESLKKEMEHILLKCPITLKANSFYERTGFQLSHVETGKHRALNVWIKKLNLTSKTPDPDARQGLLDRD